MGRMGWKWSRISCGKNDGFICRLQLDEDQMLSQSDVNNYPVKMTQQQLLLLNSFSNRITWLFSDISKLGVPMQTLQPHLTALQRMVSASRDLQCKIQSFVRKHRISDSSVSPMSAISVEMKEAAKEKTRLQSQIDALNDKLQFFSSEYQRITELYLQEKTKNSELLLQVPPKSSPTVQSTIQASIQSTIVLSTTQSTTQRNITHPSNQPTTIIEQPRMDFSSQEEKSELIQRLEQYRTSIEQL